MRIWLPAALPTFPWETLVVTKLGKPSSRKPCTIQSPRPTIVHPTSEQSSIIFSQHHTKTFNHPRGRNTLREDNKRPGLAPKHHWPSVLQPCCSMHVEMVETSNVWMLTSNDTDSTPLYLSDPNRNQLKGQPCRLSCIPVPQLDFPCAVYRYREWRETVDSRTRAGAREVGAYAGLPSVCCMSTRRCVFDVVVW